MKKLQDTMNEFRVERLTRLIAEGKLVVNDIHVTEWFGGSTHPPRPGMYDRLFVDGICRQHWDGKVWSAREGSVPHWRQVGDYPMWRGARMWVLVRIADPFISALAGQAVDVYLNSARPRSAKFGGLIGARPFLTQRQAERFAARYKHLGLTAVLP